MIKIESADGVCTITREGVDCVIFPGMIITPEEVETIVANGDVVYSIDEAIVVVVPKGEQATVSAVPAAEVVEEAPAEVPAEEVPAEVPAEAVQTEVVTETVETPAEAPKKK